MSSPARTRCAPDPEVYVSDKKILAICLSVSPPMAIKAMWHNQKLHMDQPIALPRNRTDMETRVLELMREADAKEFEVLVEETSTFITARGGRRIRLGENDETGKPLLITVLNIYRELQMQQAINLPAGISGFDLPQSIFDADKDARGNAIYHIDWASLRSSHVLTMLCCYAAQFHNPDSAYFLERMFSAYSEEETRDRYSPLRSIVNAVETDLTGVSTSPLTGKGNYL